MKKILILLLILILNCSNQNTYAKQLINTPEEIEAVENCAKGDKILYYYETKTDKTNPQRYLNAAKYYYYQASRLDLSNPNSLIGHARIALHQDKLTDAKNVLMIALNFDESNPRTNFYLGETFFREGEYTQAIDYYKQALNHGYGLDYKTNYQLGLCYEKLNDEQKAKNHYKKALEITPSSAEVQKRLQDMDKINITYTPPLSIEDEEVIELEIDADKNSVINLNNTPVQMSKKIREKK